MTQASDAIALPNRAGTFDAQPFVGFASIFFIVLLLTVCVMRLAPIRVLSAAAPLTEFSAERSMRHVKEIAGVPRPIGSAEHALVREYILSELTSLGVQPEVQETVSLNTRGKQPFRAATVHNVMARLRGTAGGKALALIAHYDSVASGPGASDDASGVAVLLETLRALKSGPPLRNDVIFLFSDAEEVGLMGAEAFVQAHPWAKEVGLVLNFEARGTSGPSLMFETSGNNAPLIKGFAASVKRPFASSLFYELYRLLSNDTDMSVFRRAGLEGLNFAFVKGAVRYHTGSDNVSAVDWKSLQHQGSNALALTRHFGNENLSELGAGGNAIYFDLLGATLINYPVSWAVPLLMATIILLAAVVVYGLRRRLLSVRGLIIGFAAVPAAIIGAVLVVSILWNLLRLLHSGYRSLLLGDTYNSDFYILSFTLLSMAISFATYFWLRRKVAAEDLAAGALTFWALPTAMTTLLLAGGSYLFTLPLLFSTLGLGAIFILKIKGGGSEVSWKGLAVLALCLVPCAILFAPTIYLMFLTLTLNMSFVGAALVALACGMFIPLYGSVATYSGGKVTGALCFLSAALLVAGGLSSGFDREHPRQDNLIYALNADTNSAVWATADPLLDEWTSRFIKAQAKPGPLADFFPQSNARFLQSPAPTESLEPPKVEVLSDETGADVRRMRLHISSPRQAQIITLTTGPGVRVAESWVAGRRLDDTRTKRGDGNWSLRYFGLPREGFELVLSIAPGPLSLRAIDQSYSLPRNAQVRPENFTAAIHPFGDSTFVAKSFNY
jgi:hypothetical protein